MNQPIIPIPLLSEAEALNVAQEHGFPEQMASLSVFRVLLKHPDLAKSVVQLLTTLLFTGNQLDKRLRELLIMRIGWATGAVYEWTQHWRVAKDLEIPDEDLLAVRDWKNSTILDETDKAVLQATDDAIEEGFITDTSWQKIKKMIPDEAQQIELVIAIGNWSLFSQLLKSLHIPLEEGTESWPPDGQVSPNA